MEDQPQDNKSKNHIEMERNQIQSRNQVRDLAISFKVSSRRTDGLQCSLLRTIHSLCHPRHRQTTFYLLLAVQAIKKRLHFHSEARNHEKSYCEYT